MANSLTHTLPWPIRNARFTLPLSFRVSAGTPTDPTTPDTELSVDGGASYTDCAEEITTGGTNGAGYLTLTGAETNNSVIHVAAKSANCVTTPAIVMPRILPVLSSGTASAGSSTSITLGTLLGYDITGCVIRTTGGTGGGGTGGANNQARIVTAYNTSTGVATVSPAWETTPDATTTYDVLVTELACNTVITRGLRPFTDGRTAVVDSNGLIDANTVKLGPSGAGTAQTARDVGANLDTTISSRAAPGNQMDLVNAPNATALAAIASSVRTEMDANSTKLAGIVANTNELQTDWANGGRLDLILDTIAADTTTDIPVLIGAISTTIGVAGAGLTSLASAANLALAKADTAATLVIANKLNTAIELDGSVYRFTINALEQAPSGGGGAVSFNVTPLIGVIDRQTVRGSGITEVFQFGPLPYGPIFARDKNNDPVNLTGEAVNLVIESLATEGAGLGIVYVLATGGKLTVGGANGDEITTAADTTEYTQMPGDWKWNLRCKERNDLVAAWGIYRIQPMAVEAAP